MHTRLTTLETKWDTVIPTLATREDLLALEGRLRDDMRYRFDDLQRWLMSTMQRWLFGIALIIVMLVGGSATMVLTKRVMPAGAMTLFQPSPEDSAAVTMVRADPRLEASGDTAP